MASKEYSWAVIDGFKRNLYKIGLKTRAASFFMMFLREIAEKSTTKIIS